MKVFTRTSWIAAGLVLIAGAVVFGANAYANAFDAASPPASHVIGWTWLAAAAALVLGSVIRDREDRDGVSVVVLPAVGIALMLPLTICLVAAKWFPPGRLFGEWAEYSLTGVAAAHILFASLVGFRAAAIAHGRTPLSVATIYFAAVCTAAFPGVVLVIPLVAVATTALAGLMIVIPPLVVAVTGLPFLPLLHAMERWCAPRPHLPFAIARAT